MVPRELVSTAIGFLHRPIRVGFLGHRPNRLPDDALTRVRAAIDNALEALEAAGKDAAARSVKFVLASALAEGADRIGAEAALARAWTLEAPLPFSIQRYEKDFADAQSIAAFQTLLKQAAKVMPMPQNDAKGSAGYVAAGLAVINGADAALVVWDGEAGQGPGGTPDIAARALEQGMPVVWIGVDESRPKLITPEEGDARKGTRARYMRAALAARFEKIERPATLRVDAG